MEQASPQDAERLQQALEAGGGVDLPSSDLPADDLSELLAVAGQLRDAAGGRAGDPRPSFVLGLEEQLRTEYRLQPPRPPASPAGSRWSGINVAAAGVALALMVSLVAGLMIERAGPGDDLWSAHRMLEQLRVAVAGSTASRVDELLDLGWRHVREAAGLASRGAWTAEARAALLPAITDSYSAAVQLAAADGDDRLRLRVARETGDAAAELHRLAGAAPPGEEPPLLAAETVLRAVIVRLGDRLVVGGPSGVPTPPLPLPTLEPPATEPVLAPSTPTEPALPTPPQATVTAVATPRPTLPPPSVVPSVQPTSLPTQLPPTPGPTRRERSRTATPRPTELIKVPSTTPLPVATGTAVPPATPTRDAWLTPPATNPVPSPSAPSETPGSP